VVAKPDERLGEVSCAFVIAVVGSEPPTLNDLSTHLEEQGMTPQFWPEDLQFVEEFPMTASGKVQKFRLRATLTS
jgi:acyl-CoA synthetase